MTPLVLVLVLLACDPPAALPASAVDVRPPPIGSLVQSGSVRGFLARPGVETPPTPAELRLVDDLDAAAKDAALASAGAGLVVLAIPDGTDAHQAHDYLSGMPSTGTVTQTCTRAECP